MDIIVASNNKGKIREIKAILGEKHSVVAMGECGIDLDIEETGTTFTENAIIKAKAIYDLTKKAVLSDDSGLVVAALNGRPGVYSARYSLLEENAEIASTLCLNTPPLSQNSIPSREEIDARNNKLLLARLEGVEDRRAEFVSVVVLYYAEDRYIVAEGRTAGNILHSEVGKEGFGYDPLFYSVELNKTFAEASMQEKNMVSHRARALISLSDKLTALE